MALAVSGAAGCGDPAAPRRHAPLARPVGADEVVAQVLVGGGLVPVESAVATVPSLTVLGDGTVITPAPVAEIYPGPAITPLQAAWVGGEVVDDLVERARRLGLLEGPLDFGRSLVADAPTTTVTISAGGRVHRQEAYALAIDDDISTSGVSDRQAANRQALKDFVRATHDLPPGQRAWTPSAVAVYRLGPYQEDPQVPQQPVDWPLARRPATEGDRPCTLFEDDEARMLLDAVSRANARTPWVVDGTRHALAFRPVVPGQPGC